MSEHAQWMKEQRVIVSPEEEPTASVFAVEKLRAALHGANVPECELHRAAIDVEKKAAEISAKHSGRSAMLRVLGKAFYIKQIPFLATEVEASPERVHHPDSDHVRRLYG